MRPNQAYLSAALTGLFALACSSSPSGGPYAGAGGGGDGGSSGGTGDTDLDDSLPDSASFNLRFTEGQKPSLTRGGRLDFRAQGTHYESMFTPRWGSPGRYDVRVTQAALKLTGSSCIFLNEGSYRARDCWDTFTLLRSADGSLSGNLSATGSHSFEETDTLGMFDIVGRAVLETDTERPEFSASMPLLPWHPLTLEVSEGVSGDELLEALSVTSTSSSDPLPVNWTLTPLPKDPSFSGSVRAVGTLDRWRDIEGTSLALRVARGVTDRNGNAARAYEATRVTLQAGPAVRAYNFSPSDVDFLARSWGGASLVDSATRADCDSDGCALLGPTGVNSCSGPHGGFIGAVEAAAGVRVSVRYRVQTETEGPTPAAGALGFTLVLVTRERQTEHVSDQTDASWTELSATEDQKTWLSEWRTLSVDLPTTADAEVRFELNLGRGAWGESEVPWCAFVRLTETAVLIDRIWVE